MGRVNSNNSQPTQDMAEATKSPQSDSSAPSGRLHPLVGLHSRMADEAKEAPSYAATIQRALPRMKHWKDAAQLEWTEQDWSDFYHALDRTLRKIYARHCKPNVSDQIREE